MDMQQNTTLLDNWCEQLKYKYSLSIQPNTCSEESIDWIEIKI